MIDGWGGLQLANQVSVVTKQKILFILLRSVLASNPLVLNNILKMDAMQWT